MKTGLLSGILITLLLSIAFLSAARAGNLPSAGNNKVAYYVFDSGGPDHYPLTSFTDNANIVVIFEGTLWELADSVHYATGWMQNVNYKYYSQILSDIRTLQARGVKVLMNLDDAAAWSTDTPFTTYDGTKLNYQQFAEFIKRCAIDSVHLDGISLDIEHNATGNTQYINLLTEIGKYFGPLSPDSASTIYTAAIYSGGQPGSVVGQKPAVAAYFNFVMDMGYWQSYITRFNRWADYIGASKVMVGVLNDNYDDATAMAAAAWQPANPPKAGIMVYAANNRKGYTDSVFSALTVTSVDEEVQQPNRFALMQNYPNPFNPSTVISWQLAANSHVTLKVYDILGREVASLVDKDLSAGSHSINWNASKLTSGVYIYQLRVSAGGVNTFVSAKKMQLIK
ncbi:MAG: T9SS type A sorting domain-containing protein [Ignavibacteriaceae bacterium]|nr:T9SS type A sorting domain-containing protein [Ignavibacteriaceae bacterium]